jgi:hypothetical protein
MTGDDAGRFVQLLQPFSTGPREPMKTRQRESPCAAFLPVPTASHYLMTARRDRWAWACASVSQKWPILVAVDP